MDKVMEKLERHLMPVADKIGSNRYIIALRDGFVYTVPFTIIGSFFLLLAFFPVPAVSNWMEASGWQSQLLLVSGVTFDIIAILVVLGVSYHLAKEYKLDAFFISVLALVCFLLLTPNFMEVEGSKETLGGIIPKVWIGSKGIFVAILTAIVITDIYYWVVQRNWTIKMPAGVPPTVASSFAALIPATVVILITWIFYMVVMGLTGGSIHEWVYNTLQMPMQSLGDNYISMVLILFITQILWFFGIHGATIVMGIITPVFQANSIANLELYQTGQLALDNGAYIITQQLFDCYINNGGSGMTLGVTLLMAFGYTKSAISRTLGKLTAPGSFFTINEPLLFGIPIVLNPIMLIPFVLAPIVAGTITYIAIAIGFMPLLNGVVIPWTTPPVISGLITSGWQGALIQIVNIVVATIIFIPFLVTTDKEWLKMEKEGK